MFSFFKSTRPPPTVTPAPRIIELQPSETQTVTLPDNRKLGYATYGSTTPSDPVIFMFHGMPGSRICGRGWDAMCRRIGARLITVDRPGCGISTLADRSLAQWPEDVTNLADQLGVRRFSVLGASGGGPFALACARFIPKERLRSTTVVCGIGPLDAIMDTTPYLSWRWMGLTKWLLQIAARYVVLPRILAPYVGQTAAGLKRVIEDQCTTPEEKEVFYNATDESNPDHAVAQFLEAFKQGTAGAMLDGKLLTRDWGFKLENVESERVWMVHGDRDAIAPVDVARWVDKRLGGGRLRVLEGKTHFTVWKEHSEEIFRQSAGL